jgi:hypothetical protein
VNGLPVHTDNGERRTDATPDQKLGFGGGPTIRHDASAPKAAPHPTLFWGSRDPLLGVLPFFGAAPSDEAVHHSDVLVDDPFLQLITRVVANVAGLR